MTLAVVQSTYIVLRKIKYFVNIDDRGISAQENPSRCVEEEK